MNQFVKFQVVQGDIKNHPTDLAVLKYADGHHGADGAVADALKFDRKISNGRHAFLPGKNIEAKEVLFIGVGPLADFRYEDIRRFAKASLVLAQERGFNIESVATTIHGPGYGLDERESFLALIAGFTDAIKSKTLPDNLSTIEIVEIDNRRVLRLRNILGNFYKDSASDNHTRSGDQVFDDNVRRNLSSFGRKSEKKIRLFVAMPFKTDFSDEWEIAIQEACQKAEIICERIDTQAYVGDILTIIKDRISKYHGVIALLNESNPNVFLEVGFAWAKEKPTILLLKSGLDLPFDIRGQRCIMYKSIAELRKLLESELVSLKSEGVFKN